LAAVCPPPLCYRRGKPTRRYVRVKNADRVDLAAFVTGPVRVCDGFVTGFLPCKLLMVNVVTDVTGLHPQGRCLDSGCRDFAASAYAKASARQAERLALKRLSREKVTGDKVTSGSRPPALGPDASATFSGEFGVVWQDMV
jgi:hypothetical protein